MENKGKNIGGKLAGVRFCHHENLIPIEHLYGTRRWNNGHSYIDWSSNVINAHVSRVTKVWCPDCGYQFDVPSDSEDK